MKRKLSILLVVCLLLAMMTACGGEKGDAAADLVLKGTVYTGDADNEMVAAVAVKDGNYVYAGEEEGVSSFIGDKTEIVEVGDGMLLPGFMEGHAHGHQGGVGYLFEVNLYEGASLEDYQETLRAFIKEHPEMDFINGGGWLNGYFPPSGPTKEMLDEVSTELPIVLVSADHHSYWANSKALEMAKIDASTPDVPGGVIARDNTGNPTGVFRETANALIEAAIPMYTVDQYKEGIIAYQEEAKSYGITAYYEPMVNLDGGTNLLEAYNALEEEGKLQIRVFGGYLITADNNPMEELDKCLEIVKSTKGGDFQVNSIKLLVDGVVEGKTAYLMEGYADQPDYKGEVLWTQEELNQVCAKADKLDIIVHSHAIGDAAVKMTVDAYEFAAKENDTTGKRHAITHLQIVAQEEIDRMADLGVVAVTNPYWFRKEPGYFYELEVPYLGEERANHQYPMKSFFDAGVTVVSASDFPVTMPAMPLAAIETGVTRCDSSDPDSTLQNPEQRVSVKQMIAASTINGAYANFSEGIFGTIEVGKSADFVLLDKNILDIPGTEIGKTNVLATYIKGQKIFDAAK